MKKTLCVAFCRSRKMPLIFNFQVVTLSLKSAWECLCSRTCC